MRASSSSLVNQSPSIERFDRCTGGAVIFSGSGDGSFQERIRIRHQPIDGLPGDATQRNLQATTPTTVMLSRIRADIDVDELLIGRTLRDRTTKLRVAALAVALHVQREFEM